MQLNNKKEKIKCVVWDLDNTIWEGILLEDTEVTLKKDIKQVIQGLDERGILQSIASKNDYSSAKNKLMKLGIDEFFLYPQINWNSKSSSIKTIAEKVNLSVKAFAFIDDQQFELDEVSHSVPDVLCINSSELAHLLDMPEMNPTFITDDSKNRRLMYQNDITRNRIEEEFIGPKEEFLASLNMKFTISPARLEDLQRAEELTIRTHQLNATGYTYSYDELNGFRVSPKHKLLITGLDDKYGTYGKIGLALIECSESSWTLKLLLMSCRVMSRGVGSVLLNYVIQLAKKAGMTSLFAEFIPNDRNRIMLITYKFAGFYQVGEKDGLITFCHDLKQIQKSPGYISVIDLGGQNEN